MGARRSRARDCPRHPARRRHRLRLDRAAPDRDALFEGRVRAARSDGELSPRPRRASDAGGQQPGHRRSEAAGPRREIRAHRNAHQMERQFRGVPDRRARRSAAWAPGPRSRELGPDRQAPATADQQAVRASRIRSRHRRQHHLAGDSVRTPWLRAGGQRQAERRVCRSCGDRQSAAGAGTMRGHQPSGQRRGRGGRPAPQNPRAAHARPLRLSRQPVRHRLAALRRDRNLQRILHKHQRQWTNGHRHPGRRRERPCQFRRRHLLQGLAEPCRRAGETVRAEIAARHDHGRAHEPGRRVQPQWPRGHVRPRRRLCRQ